MKEILSLGLILMIFVYTGFSQSAQKPDFSTGPEINEKIPDFSLPDQYGILRNIRDLASDNGALIIFHRSASW